MPKPRILWAALVAATVAGCNKTAPPTPEPRPVRTVTVERVADGETVSFTGQIRAKDQVNLAFRLDGRMIERPVNVGDVLAAGQVVARLDSQNQQNALRSAEANLASAQAALTQARLTFGRQQELLKNGWTPRAKFDDAQEALRTAEAQVDSAQAQLRIAAGSARLHGLARRQPGRRHGDRRRAGRGRAGRADDRAARADRASSTPFSTCPSSSSGPARAIRSCELALSDDPQVQATGHVRQVAPQADSATRTFQVKVGINNPPEGMRLGSTVTGRIKLAAPAGVEVPASALTEGERPPGRLGGRSPEPDGVAAHRRRRALRPGERRDLAGAREGRRRGHRRRADAAPGPEGPPAGRRLMKSFNLSEWALRHRSLVTYFMLMIVVAGIAAYFKLGRSEDPDFTVKTMVVHADWPGATVERHARADHRPPRAQAAGDAEPRLREELHERRPRHDLRQPEGLDAAGRRAGHLVPGAQEGARHRAARCRRASSAPASTTSSATPTASSTASPPTASPTASCSDYVDDVRKQLLELPDISKIDILGRPGRARVRRVLAREARRARHRPLRADRRAQEPERRHAGGRGADRRREDPGARLRRVPVRAGHSRHQLRRRTAA